MHIRESEEDYDEPRFSSGSLSCLFPILTKNDSPGKSLSYDKLHQQPLRLSVLKLDGTSFEIEVTKSGTVEELKKAVESAFSHLPKQGPGKVSWKHVWGQFCLSHEGHRLLSDSDYISLFGIKDGDQLQFVHHASNAYNLVKVQSDHSDDEPNVSGGHRDEVQKDSEKEDVHQLETLEEKKDNAESDDDDDDDDDDLSRCRHRLTNLFACWFPYMKLPNSKTISIHESRSETWKGT